MEGSPRAPDPGARRGRARRPGRPALRARIPGGRPRRRLGPGGQRTGVRAPSPPPSRKPPAPAAPHLCPPRPAPHSAESRRPSRRRRRRSARPGARGRAAAILAPVGSDGGRRRPCGLPDPHRPRRRRGPRPPAAQNPTLGRPRAPAARAPDDPGPPWLSRAFAPGAPSSVLAGSDDPRPRSPRRPAALAGILRTPQLVSPSPSAPQGWNSRD